MIQEVYEPSENYLLYADDDADDRAILIEMMRRIDPSVRVVTMEHGLALVQYLGDLIPGNKLPSCIVLDMNMPVWDGIRTLRIIKEDIHYKDIPVFLFSTSTSVRDASLVNAMGAEAFITKPFGQKELMSVCEEFAAFAQKPSHVR